MPGIESRFRSRKALVDAAFVSFVCAIVVATGGRFRPLVLFFFISVGLLWLMGCKLGRWLGNTLGQGGKGEPRWNTKFTRRLVRADVSFLGPLIGRLGALSITLRLLGEQLILMGRVGASNWQGFLMIGSAVSGIAIAEKIHRDTIGFRFGPGSGNPLVSTESARAESGPGEAVEPEREVTADWAEIRNAFRDSDKVTRFWAIGELSAIGGEEAIRLLETQVEDEDPEISTAAKKALAAIKEES